MVRFKSEKAVVRWFSKMPHLQIDCWKIKSWRLGYEIVALNATSVGMGRRNRFFLCMCCRNCIIVIIIIVIINIIVYIVFVVNFMH